MPRASVAAKTPAFQAMGAGCDSQSRAPIERDEATTARDDARPTDAAAAPGRRRVLRGRPWWTRRSPDTSRGSRRAGNREAFGVRVPLTALPAKPARNQKKIEWTAMIGILIAFIIE